MIQLLPLFFIDFIRDFKASIQQHWTILHLTAYIWAEKEHDPKANFWFQVRLEKKEN